VAADDVAARAARKRWEVNARRAREAALRALPEVARTGAVEWYGFDDSADLSRRCAAVGADPGRVIQRWDDPALFAALAAGIDWAGVDCDLLLLDHPDAGWARVTASRGWLPLLDALPRLVDGFLFFRPHDASVLSVDVETSDDDRWVETTLIGPGFSPARTAFAAGPPPLPIVPRHH
jgi:hypothetical protein